MSINELKNVFQRGKWVFEGTLRSFRALKGRLKVIHYEFHEWSDPTTTLIILVCVISHNMIEGMKHRGELLKAVNEQGKLISYVSCISGQKKYNPVDNNGNRDSNSGNFSVAGPIGLVEQINPFRNSFKHHGGNGVLFSSELERKREIWSATPLQIFSTL